MGVKKTVYTAAEVLGLQELSLKFSRKGFHILCYHGICADNSELIRFRPKIFMGIEAFQKRMAWLLQKGFSILDLEMALTLQSQNKLTEPSVVITFDEGFKSYRDHALGVLEKLNITATVYVTTYHVEKQTPVFRLVMQYLDWKWGLPLYQIDAHIQELSTFKANSRKLMTLWDVILFCEDRLSESRRFELIKSLLKYLMPECTESERMSHISPFLLMNHEEIFDCSQRGTRIELHTHRHKPNIDRMFLQNEIERNKSSLKIADITNPKHLAYPSGIWSKNLLPYLNEMELSSAATCRPGLNMKSTNPYALNRFVDSSYVSYWEFRAEMMNFSSCLRRLTGKQGKDAAHVNSNDDISKVMVV